MNRSRRHGNVVVIGGGITGLAAAHALQARPREEPLLEVTLVETSDRLGGKILTERIDGFTIEAGPDSFLTTRPAAVELCARLGLGDHLVGTGPGGRTVYVLHRGRLRRLPDGLALIIPVRVMPFLRSDLFSPWEKLRMGMDLLIPPEAHREDEALGALVRRRLGRAVAERLAAPLLGGIYAGDVDRLSVQATFPQLAEMERRDGSLIAGMLARQADGVASAPSRLPLFMTLAGGLDTLVERLTASTRCTVLTRSPVRAITPAAGTKAGGGYLIHLAHGALSADAVVLAVPAPAAADLLREMCPSASALLREIPYVSTAAVALGYREEDIPVPLDGHGFVVGQGEDCRLTACTWVSSKWTGRAPPGHALLRGYLGRAGDESALGLDDGAVVAVVHRELQAILGISAAPVLARIYRWPAAMPQYLVGHLRRLEAIEGALESVPGIVLAGAGYRGIGIPDCIRQGVEAAGRIVEILA